MRAREIFLALDMEDEADSCVINLCGCLLEGDNSTKPVKILTRPPGPGQSKEPPSSRSRCPQLAREGQ